MSEIISHDQGPDFKRTKRPRSLYTSDQKLHKKHYKHQERDFLLEDFSDFQAYSDQFIEESALLERRVNENYHALPKLFQEVIVRFHRDGEWFLDIAQDPEIIAQLRMHFKDDKSRNLTLVKRAYIQSICHLAFIGHKITLPYQAQTS